MKKKTHKKQSANENFTVIIVVADVLAPLGARTSAGTVITKYTSCIYTRIWDWDLKSKNMQQKYFSVVGNSSIHFTVVFLWKQ